MTATNPQAPVIGSKNVTGLDVPGSRAKVFFTPVIDAEHLFKLYRRVNEGIYGRTAIKLHTGEKNGPNILPRDLVRDFQSRIPNSNIVETNTLYEGDRYTTEGHCETLKVNGWDFCPVDILDEEGGVDLPVRNGFHLDHVTMGGHIVNYDSLIVLTHFKGHAMGGFGGSMKNIAIGLASGRVGKRQVHGVVDKIPESWTDWPMTEPFMELMVDSAKATLDYFGKHVTFINVLRRMSVDCDCAGVTAAEPTIPDIGILASTDLLAIDQASVDLVFNHESNKDLVERMTSRHGLRQLSGMAEKKMGNPQYELITIEYPTGHRETERARKPQVFWLFCLLGQENFSRRKAASTPLPRVSSRLTLARPALRRGTTPLRPRNPLRSDPGSRTLGRRTQGTPPRFLPPRPGIAGSFACRTPLQAYGCGGRTRHSGCRHAVWSSTPWLASSDSFRLTRL